MEKKGPSFAAAKEGKRMNKIIDSHIHLDRYADQDIANICSIQELESLITVSWDLSSCKKNLLLAERFSKVKPAFGYHPEQVLPPEAELADLIGWMGDHKENMIAIGEVGLPYYLRQEQGASFIGLEPYLEILELFVQKAKEWQLPVILHSIYEDAEIVCSLLEKYSIEKAHFHWFKGSALTAERMAANGYFISVTPDVLYEGEIQSLVKDYPIRQVMAETDGPWPFEGPFNKQMTSPLMIHRSAAKIAEIKKMALPEVYTLLLTNTRDFYRI
ncbi:TatD family hydrolase [Bacillus infantis]|nr:TatD family hydrolase [Bacillus infantis]